ncbi:glycoside hydrolase family 43 protein [Aspergillus ibericus CBS 121593]|uniref:Arabinanase/levansucrase/invertase n=1 Tax=Aspergillus ibericus CBS 121593 TaxID=1448316 RepID=A0A395HDX7_9EURO|nr:Arabinanase/levansucrase/invertase [Aspergillus ibericus CBS 121593]RAL06052.1 Arabinanase/levansucrase/invertase [Aspergillus ibericus CBS 121593]
MNRIRSILSRDKSLPTTWIQSGPNEGTDEGISPAKLPSPEEQGTRASMIWTRKRVVLLVIMIFLGVAIIVVVIAVPVVLLDDGSSSDDPSYHNQSNRPIRVVDDFPDPGLVHVNGTWYAYGTNANVPHVPVATSPNFTTWTRRQGYDALPILSSWETNVDHYAPDVIQREDGRFVLYYSGELKDWLRHHCVGVAVSNGTNPLGPYVPRNQTLACPRDQGGAIDPAPFKDVDGTLYVVYKADGNSIGHGGDCNNGNKPIVATPILLQQLQKDGVTPVGDPVEILTNEKVDGPLVEAPDIIRTDQGVYYLFFSSHCYTSPKYDVKYAWSTSLRGPYIRAERPLFRSGDFGLESPGGATASVDGTRMVFHANCGDNDRCMYAAAINISTNHTITPAALGT